MVDVARIEGDSEYKQTMIRQQGADLVYSPPYIPSLLGSVKRKYLQVVRRVRRLRGIPSTQEIGTLANMLYSLREATKDKLGYPINRAVAAIPALWSPDNWDGDLEEAFEHAGMYKLRSSRYRIAGVAASNAGYVGMGHGLCKVWSDGQKCMEEEAEMDVRLVLTVSLDADALYVRSTLMASAYKSLLTSSISGPDLGYDNHEGEGYWDAIVSRIKWIADTFLPGQKIDQIVLMGEYAQETKFLNAVWRALNDLADQGYLAGRAADVYSDIQISGFSSLYVGARGAAELALRWQGDLGGCVSK